MNYRIEVYRRVTDESPHHVRRAETKNEAISIAEEKVSEWEFDRTKVVELVHVAEFVTDTESGGE